MGQYEWKVKWHRRDAIRKPFSLELAGFGRHLGLEKIKFVVKLPALNKDQ